VQIAIRSTNGPTRPTESIDGMYADARAAGAFEHQQLVPERKHFSLQSRSGSNGVSQAREQGQEERPHVGEA
jgi:hypothetical protein